MNLGLGQSGWNQIMRIVGFYAHEIGRRKAALRDLRERRTQVLENFDSAGDYSSWAATGAEIGANTDESAYVYCSSAVAVSTLRIRAYKNAAKTALVCSGTGISGAGFALAETGDSGLSMTLTVPASPASASLIRLELVQDSLLRLGHIFPATDRDLGNWRERLSADLAAALSTAESELQTMVSAWEREILDGLADALDAPGDVREEGVHSYVHTDTGGAIALSHETGMLAWLADTMGDDGTPQAVRANTAAVGSVSADADNDGAISVSGATAAQNALPGTVRIVVTDETIGSARLSVSLQLAEPLADGSESIDGENEATRKQPWTDGRMGVSFTPNPGPIVETGDTINVLSGYVVTGESATTTDEGVIYWKIVANPPTGWTVSLHTSPTRMAGNQVATTNAASGAGTDPISLTGGGMTVTANFNKSAAAAIATIETDIQTPRLRDSWEFAVTNDLAGALQSFFAYLHQMRLPSSASPTIDDGLGKTYPLVYRGDEA